MNKVLKIAGAIISAGLLLGAGYALHQPDTVTIVKEQIKEVPVDRIVNITKEVPVEVRVEVPVDNGKLATVMQFMQNINEDITEEYMIFDIDARIEAEAYIRDNLKDLLKEDDYFKDNHLLQDYRVSEVSISKIYDPEVLSLDYEDMNLELMYQVKVKAKESSEDSEYFKFNVTIPFEDKELIQEDIEVEYLG